MRSLLPRALVLSAALAAPAAASDRTASVVVSAQFASRTSLRVSTEHLRFDVTDPGEQVTAVVTFEAGARTPRGAEVVLSVEPSRALDGPGGAADAESTLTFSGEGEGTTAGVMHDNHPAVAGRWTGSGLRTGRLVFVLHASAAGTYTMPVRFVLSAP